MNLHDFIFTIVAFFSELLGTISGFGSSTFFVPIAVHVEKFELVLVLTSILHCFGNTSKILLFREQFKWQTFYRLAIPSFIFAGIGALLTEQVSVLVLQRGLGIVLIVLSAIFLLGKFHFKRWPTWVAMVLCGISGFTTGLVGTGGAIRAIALTGLEIERGSFVLLSAAIDFGGDFIRMIIYFRNGFMDWTQWFYIPLLGVAAFLGAKLGKRLLKFVNQDQFEKIVAAAILMGGVLMLLE